MINCLEFENLQNYLEAIESLSDSEIEEELKSISNLRNDIQYSYISLKSKVFCELIEQSTIELNKSNADYESFIKNKLDECELISKNCERLDSKSQFVRDEIIIEDRKSNLERISNIFNEIKENKYDKKFKNLKKSLFIISAAYKARISNQKYEKNNKKLIDAPEIMFGKLNPKEKDYRKIVVRFASLLWGALTFLEK